MTSLATVAGPLLPWALFAILAAAASFLFFPPLPYGPSSLPASPIAQALAVTPLDERLSGTLLHLCGGLLLAWICRRLQMTAWTSVGAGLLFLVAVAPFRAVHGAAGLDPMLGLVAALAGAGLLLQYGRTAKGALLVPAAVCLVAGALAQAAAVAAAALCLPRPTGDRPVPSRRLRAIAAGAVGLTLVTSLWVSEAGAGADAVGHLLWGADRLLLTAYWMPLVPLYEADAWEHLFGGAFLLGLCLAAVRRQGPAAAWAAWTLAGLAAAALFGLPAAWAEEGPSRFLYLPAAGMAALTALLLERAARRHLGLPIVLALLLAAGSVHAYPRTRAVSLYLAGSALREGGDLDGGAALVRPAVAAGPDVLPLYNALLLLCEAAVGPERDPRPILTRTLQLFPAQREILLFELALDATSSDPQARAGAVGRLQSFVGHIDADGALLLGKYFHNVGFAYHLRGDPATAIAAYDWALAFDRRRFITQKNLSNALIKTQQYQRAIASLEAAAALWDGDQTVYFTLGNMYSWVGQLPQAAKAYARTLQLKPDHLDAYRRLGAVLEAQGQWREAAAVFGQGLQRAPNDPTLQDGLLRAQKALDGDADG